MAYHFQSEIAAMTRLLTILLVLFSVVGVASLLMILGSIIHICISEHIRPTRRPVSQPKLCQALVALNRTRRPIEAWVNRWNSTC